MESNQMYLIAHDLEALTRLAKLYKRAFSQEETFILKTLFLYKVILRIDFCGSEESDMFFHTKVLSGLYRISDPHSEILVPIFGQDNQVIESIKDFVRRFSEMIEGERLDQHKVYFVLDKEEKLEDRVNYYFLDTQVLVSGKQKSLLHAA